MTPTPASRHTRRPRRTTIVIPPEQFSIARSVVITHADGTTTDVTGRVISITIVGLSIREGISNAIINLDNSEGFFLNQAKDDWKFVGGETIKIDMDFEGGTTRVFKGKCNTPKVDFDGGGHRLMIVARTAPQVADRRINITINGSAVDAVKDILDTFLSDSVTHSAFDTNLGTETTTIKVSYNNYIHTILADIFRRAGWEGYFDFDASDTGKHDLVGFKAGASHNDDVNLSYSQNLISVNGFGKETDQEYNNILVKGKNRGGAAIMRTTRNDSHENQFWRKDLVVSDSNVINFDELAERADVEIADKIPDNKFGTVKAVGHPKIVAGKTINVSNPHSLIHGLYTVRRYVHNIDSGGWIMEVDIAGRRRRLNDLFKDTIKVEDRLSEFDNPNNMAYSFNLDFEEDSDAENLIAQKTAITVTGGKIQISSGAEGNITSTQLDLPEDVSNFDMALDGAEQFEISTVQVSNDGGTTFVTVTDNMQNSEFSFNAPDNRLIIKVTLKADGDKNTNPSLDGLVVRCK